MLVLDTKDLKDDYYTYYHRFVAMDLGVVHNRVILFAYYEFLHSSIVILREWYKSGPKLTTDMIAQIIKIRNVNCGVADHQISGLQTAIIYSYLMTSASCTICRCSPRTRTTSTRW
jgi:hypothetical protein